VEVTVPVAAERPFLTISTRRPVAPLVRVTAAAGAPRVSVTAAGPHPFKALPSTTMVQQVSTDVCTITVETVGATVPAGAPG
jgi:hypothetical protein